MRRCRLRAATTLLLLSLPGCTADDPAPAPTRPPASSAPATSAATALSLTDRRELDAPGAISVFGDVFGQRAAWAAGDGDRFDRVVVADVGTGKSEVVVRTPRHHIDWVRGHGDTIVYRELAAPPTDVERNNWEIKQLDLGSGRTTTIARSARPAATNPSPLISADAVAWVEGEQGEQHVRVYDRRTRTTSSVYRSAAVASLDLDGAQLFFVDGSRPGRPVLTVAAAGGEASVLVPDADALSVRASRTHVVYAYGDDPDSDPAGLRAYDRGSRQVVDVTDSSSTLFAAGDGVVAWLPLAEDRLVAAPFGGPRNQVVLQAEHVNIPLRLAADGDRVLWGESRLIPDTAPARFTNRVFTARLVPAGR